MSRSYIFELKGDPADFVARARELARENGAKVVGDDKRGKVQVFGVAGDYTRKGQTVVITIRKKTFCVPWALLESQLRRFFGGPGVRA